MNRHQGRDPAALTVAVKDGGLARVTGYNLVDASTQRMQDVDEPLMGTGCREKSHEIDWMAFMQGDPDLGFALEPAHAWTMTGTRVDDDDRRLRLIDAILSMLLPDRRNAQQRVMAGCSKHPASSSVSYWNVSTGGMPASSCSIMMSARRRSTSQNSNRSLPGVDPVAPKLAGLEGRHAYLCWTCQGDGVGRHLWSPCERDR